MPWVSFLVYLFLDMQRKGVPLCNILSGSTLSQKILALRRAQLGMRGIRESMTELFTELSSLICTKRPRRQFTMVFLKWFCNNHKQPTVVLHREWKESLSLCERVVGNLAGQESTHFHEPTLINFQIVLKI